MTAQEMDPREDHVRWVLANAREQSRREVDRNTVTMALELLDEVRAQRDEIREAHRVELAAVKAKLAALVEAVDASLAWRGMAERQIPARVAEALDAALRSAKGAT